MSKAGIESARSLIQLMREFQRLKAENRALSAILRGAEQLGDLSFDWEPALEALQKTPEYQSIAQEFEELFRSAEARCDINECMAMIQGKDFLPN